MADSPVPPPSEDEVMMARQGLLTQAKARGVDLESEELKDFFEYLVDFRANLFAENRWMSNILHIPANWKKD